jgi:hypothetical protein
MINKKTNKLLSYLIAAVWFVNGLFCKILNLEPRHEQILTQILESKNSRNEIIVIGVSEIGMAIWVLSNLFSKQNAIVQIIIVTTMNTIEYFLASELLLWGKINSLFAFLFISLVYYKEFHLNIKITHDV